MYLFKMGTGVARGANFNFSSKAAVRLSLRLSEPSRC
jgi:hypothetical protein